MATHPRLVNKQFNSPIGLYSAQNVQEVLEREAQILANGAIGINFHNPDVGKPANLKNSAVLRMLEEEENRQRNGIGPGAKRVAWPPPNESGLDSPYVEQNAVSPQGGPQYPSQSPGFQQNNYQAPAQQQPVSYNPPTHRPLKPLDVSTGGSSPLASPLVNQSPQGFRSATPNKGWAPVHSPVTTPTQPSWQPYSPSAASSLSQSSLQQHSPSVAAPSQPSWQQSAPSAVAPSQPSWRQSASKPQQQQSPSQPQQQHTSSTHFQAAHQSVSQHTYLGQTYANVPLHPSQQQHQLPQQQYQAPSQQYQAPSQQYQSPQQQYQPPQQQYQQPQQQYQPPQQQYQPPQQQYQSPQQQYQSAQQQFQSAQQQFQSAQQQFQSAQQQYQSPQQQYQPSQDQYQVPPQQYQASSQQYQVSSPQYQASAQQNQAPLSSPKPAAAPSQVAPRVQSAPASKPVEPPPSTITLRQNAPVSQAPPPVVTSQPATATLKGGKHLRGDLKWPPENVRIQVAEENRLRLELAKGPACRPRRPNKDYTEFFEQHALNSTYPGYKIPPGTQFYRPE